MLLTICVFFNYLQEYFFVSAKITTFAPNFFSYLFYNIKNKK